MLQIERQTRGRSQLQAGAPAAVSGSDVAYDIWGRRKFVRHDVKRLEPRNSHCEKAA